MLMTVMLVPMLVTRSRGRPAQVRQRALQVTVHPLQLLDRRSQMPGHVVETGRARLINPHAVIVGVGHVVLQPVRQQHAQFLDITHGHASPPDRDKQKGHAGTPGFKPDVTFMALNQMYAVVDG
jgi:hypothetical protein